MDPNIIINKIKNSGITPISRKHFIFKRALVIGLGIIVTILGALVFAKITASLLTASWKDWDYVFNSFGSFVYFAMPVSWVLTLIAFIILTPFILEKTSNGYKYKRIILILFSILSSIILGLVILKVGAYTGINKFFVTNVEKHEAILWTKPMDGRLSGHITARATESLIIQDFKGKIWAVDISNVLDLSKKIAQEEENIKIIGIEIDDNTFLACQILPFDVTETPNLGHVEETGDSSTKISVIAKDICAVILRNDL